MSDLFHFPAAAETPANQPRTRAMIVARISSHAVCVPGRFGKDVEYGRLSDADDTHARSAIETLCDFCSALRSVIEKASGLFGRRSHSR